MRKATECQSRFDCEIVSHVRLNLECRDEIIPILRSLQQVYSRATLRGQVLQLIRKDVNRDSRTDVGREGFDYWQILVLAAVRQGCGLDYDKLQDLAEQHRALRQIMRIGDWEDGPSFSWQRIRDNVCLLRAETIAEISRLIVGEGHRISPEAAAHVRADSFVMETNIHYPTEATLIRDGIHQIVSLATKLASTAGITGWRQADHLEKRANRLCREIQRIASRKGANYQQRLKDRYRLLIRHTEKITQRASLLLKTCAGPKAESPDARVERLKHFLELTGQVLNTTRRRVLKGESVPNSEKLFSIYETHTQLYKRGKAGEPVQFGRLVLVYEDAAGFIVHQHLLPRDAQDRDVVVEQTKIVKNRLGKRLKSLSFDRGFHSPEIQEQLADLAPTVCIPMPGVKQSKEQTEQATKEFRAARERHPGIESAIAALQSGNGLERCRDRTEPGFQRYLMLGVLGRNLHVLGKLVIAKAASNSHSAMSKRAKAA